MKPQELYSGPAPAAMGQMGQGLVEAGANIGRSLQSGYESLGKSIGQGLAGLGSAYASYQTAKTTNDITKAMVNDPEYSKLLGIDISTEQGQQQAKQYTSTIDSLIKSHGQVGAAQFSGQFLAPLQQYILEQKKLEAAKSIAEKNALFGGKLPVFSTPSAPVAPSLGSGYSEGQENFRPQKDFKYLFQ